jgi:hypothetical protein
MRTEGEVHTDMGGRAGAAIRAQYSSFCAFKRKSSLGEVVNILVPGPTFTMALYRIRAQTTNASPLYLIQVYDTLTCGA